ncbi:hypothetical protein D3C77_820000 [compost metagenome]
MAILQVTKQRLINEGFTQVQIGIGVRESLVYTIVTFDIVMQRVLQPRQHMLL